MFVSLIWIRKKCKPHYDDLTLQKGDACMAYNGKVVGGVIRTLRTKKNVTQEELSGLSGIARSHLAAIESGKNTPSLETFWKIADALNYRPSVILKMVEDGK